MKLNFRQTDGSSSATPVLPPPSAIPSRRLFHSSSAAPPIPPIPPPIPHAPQEDSQNENEEDTSVLPQSPSPVVHNAHHQVPLSPSYSTMEVPLPILHHDPSPTFFSQLPPQAQLPQPYTQSSREEQSRRPVRHTGQPRRGRSTPRSPRLTLQKVLLYTTGLLFVLAMPFVLPVAISHAVRLAHASTHILPVEIRLTERAKHSLFQAWSEALDAINLSSSNKETWSPSIVWAGSTAATPNTRESSTESNSTELSNDTKPNSTNSNLQINHESTQSKATAESSAEHVFRNAGKEQVAHGLQNAYSGSSLDHNQGSAALGMYTTGLPHTQVVDNMEANGHPWGQGGFHSPSYDATLSTSALYGHPIMAVPVPQGVPGGDLSGIVSAQQHMEGMATSPQSFYDSYGTSSIHSNGITPPAAPMNKQNQFQNFDQTAYLSRTGGSVLNNPPENFREGLNLANTQAKEGYMSWTSGVSTGMDPMQNSRGGQGANHANLFESETREKDLRRNPIEQNSMEVGQFERSVVSSDGIERSESHARESLGGHGTSGTSMQDNEMQFHLVEKDAAVKNIRDTDAVKKRIANAARLRDNSVQGTEIDHVDENREARQVETNVGDNESSSRYRREKRETKFTERDIPEATEVVGGERGIPPLSEGGTMTKEPGRGLSNRKVDTSSEYREEIVSSKSTIGFPSELDVQKIPGDGKGNVRGTEDVKMTRSDIIDQRVKGFGRRNEHLAQKKDDSIERKRTATGQGSISEKRNLQTDVKNDGERSGEYERVYRRDFKSSSGHEEHDRVTESSVTGSENNRAASTVIRNDVIKGNARTWEKYAVVSDGQLHLARTIGRRLTEEIGPRMNGLSLEQIIGKMDGCSKITLDSVTLDSEKGVPAKVAVTTGCGHGQTCVAHADINDLHRLVLVVEGKENGYLLVSQSSGSETKKWGPVQGPLRVTVADDGVAILGGICERNEGESLSWTKKASIGDIKRTLRDIDNSKGRPINWDDVFTYEAHPRRHVAQKS